MADAWSRPRRLTACVVLACLVVIFAADLLIWQWRTAPRGIEALFDEPAHIATGLVALAAFGVAFAAPVPVAVLAGSLLIDIDHLPNLLVGSHVLDQGVPRPYTHSLGMIVLVAAAGLLQRSSNVRRLAVIVALVLGLHFFRDMAEPGGPGVALLWPLSNDAFAVAYGWYAGLLVVLASLALWRRRAAHGQAASLTAVSPSSSATR